MKPFWLALAVGATLLGSVATAPAQRYYQQDDDEDDGPPMRGRGGYEYQQRDYAPQRGRGGGGYGFSESEYLKCNPDVRRSVQRGETVSGAEHYRIYGRREGRRLSC